MFLIPSPVSNETNEKKLFLPIIGELSKFITRPICFPNNEYWYNDPSLAEIKPCNAVEEKSSTKTTQQRQAILEGFIGTALLISGVYGSFHNSPNKP